MCSGGRPAPKEEYRMEEAGLCLPHFSFQTSGMQNSEYYIHRASYSGRKLEMNEHPSFSVFVYIPQ